MSANITRDGVVRRLERPVEPDEQITPGQVQDTERMVRLFGRILRDIVSLKRRWMPRRIDFEDRSVDDTGTTLYRFSHGFGSRVRWWVVDWKDPAPPLFGGGAMCPQLVRDGSSDDNTLVLVSHMEGIATIRVEESG